VADELIVGTVVRVDEHPGARAPSLLVTLDLGPRGRREAVLSTGAYDGQELEGRQLLCRLEAEGALVLGAQSHAKGFVLLAPADEVEPGTLVS